MYLACLKERICNNIQKTERRRKEKEIRWKGGKKTERNGKDGKKAEEDEKKMERKRKEDRKLWKSKHLVRLLNNPELEGETILA